MSEEKPDLEELMQRINQLLNVLNMISKDLADISNSLKKVGVPEAAPQPAPPLPPPAKAKAVKDVQALFPDDLMQMLEFEETEEYVKIKPRQYLGSGNFAKIASIIRGAGGEYISAGKQSHFRVPKEKM
jgi:hypothetical protein